MARKQTEMQIIMHWPNTELGWRILLGRIAILNELKTAQSQGEKLNLDACIRQITQTDALEAYERLLKRQRNQAHKQRVKWHG